MSLLLLILPNLTTFSVGYVNVQSEQTHKHTKLRTSTIYRILIVYLCCAVLRPLVMTDCDPVDCSSPSSSVHRDSPDRNIGVGCHALLQVMFPTQGSNPGLLPSMWILYQLSHHGSPWDYGDWQVQLADWRLKERGTVLPVGRPLAWSPESQSSRSRPRAVFCRTRKSQCAMGSPKVIWGEIPPAQGRHLLF